MSSFPPYRGKDGQCVCAAFCFVSFFSSVGIGHQSKIQHSYLSTFIFILFTQPFRERHKPTQANREVNAE